MMAGSSRQAQVAGTDPDLILVEQRGAVRWLWLNRPARLNTLTPELVAGLERSLDDAMADDGTEVLVVAGAGRGFCAGADLTHLLETIRGGEEPFAFLAHVSACFTRIEHAPKPVVAAVHGHVVGGGLELALACDLVIARAGTMIGDGHVRNGLLPAAGSSVRLPRKIGEPLARKLMLTGELLPAEKFTYCGFVDEVAPDEQFEQAVTVAADKLATTSGRGVHARVKELLRNQEEAPPGDALARELEVFAEHWRQSDVADALSAFASRKEKS